MATSMMDRPPRLSSVRQPDESSRPLVLPIGVAQLLSMMWISSAVGAGEAERFSHHSPHTDLLRREFWRPSQG
jgi:hypothetical protein